MRKLLLDLASLVWPTECAVCGAADRDLCETCRLEFERPAPVLKHSIGVPCFSAGPYDGALRALLLEFKHGGRTGFAPVLGARLRSPLACALAECERVPLLVAAPSRAAQVRSRGFRHVERLVAKAVKGQGVRHIRVRALRAGRGRKAQVGLSAADRERNAVRIGLRPFARRVLRGREVIVIDDVFTTGATLRAACAAVESGGGRVVAAVTLCAALRRDAKSAFGVAADSADAVEFGKATEHVT